MSKSSAVNRAVSPPSPSAESGGFIVRGDTLTVQTEERVELTDVTDRVLAIVRTAAVREGIVSLWSLHTTFSVFMAGARTPEAMTTSAIRRLIRAAGRDPIERDTLYNVVTGSEAPDGERLLVQ